MSPLGENKIMKQQPNPLVPQGTFESQARGKSHVRIAVFTILAIHVVVLGALLIQGCKRDKEETAITEPAIPTNDFSSIPPFGGTNDILSTPVPTNPGIGTSPFSNPPTPPAMTSAPVIPPYTPTIPTTPSPAIVNNAAEGTPGTEHVIVKGDSFSSLATKFGVSARSIQNANPNLNPTRLKIGDKVKIPAKAAATSNFSGNNGAVAASSSSDTYVVKSGDTLGKIAKTHATTARELQRLNNLTTTQIRVGQKLKIPARATMPATATPNPATPGASPPGGPVAPFPAPAQ